VNREDAAGRSPEEMSLGDRVRLRLKKKRMTGNLTKGKRDYGYVFQGKVNRGLAMLPSQSLNQGAADIQTGFPRTCTPDRKQ
uniref:Uncharacterized protein n=1 Tax=Macaca mulatta TaxID=9544 RepID=A0A5F7ZAJ4_MACMU